MKLYIKSYSTYIDDESLDIKKELKQRYKLDTRRQDRFIHLAVYGSQLLKQKCKINEDDELYLTSGVGNIDIVQKTNTYMYKDNQTLKLFDFINLLGNTTSYYVAKSLGIKGKNIFQISDNFTYINTLISAYCSIMASKKDVIICSIDLTSNPENISKRVMGVKESCEIKSCVSYQKFSLQSEGAIGEIEFDLKESLTIEEDKKPFETYASFVLNSTLDKKENLEYEDISEGKKRVIKIKSLI